MNEIINNTNTTLLEPQEVTFLVEKFQSYARKTAESILEMAKVVIEAKKLDSEGFGSFCNEIGFNPKSSTIRKFIQIGDKYELLISRSNKLPTNWTTIYEISKLTSDQIIELIENGKINQVVLGSTIKQLNNTKTDKEEIRNEANVHEKKSEVPNGTPQGLSFTAEIKEIGSLINQVKLKILISDLESLKIKVQMAPELKVLLEKSLSLAA
jgi:hypothetical protein